MNSYVSQFGRLVTVLSGLALLSAGLIGCQTSRDYEKSWAAGVGGSAVTSSENFDSGYGPNAYIRKRVADNFKIQAQGTATRHNDVQFTEGTAGDGEIDSTFASLTGQFEFMPSDKSDLRLFVGGGATHTSFTNEEASSDSGLSNVDVQNETGGIAQVGLTVPWGFYLTANRLFNVEPDVEGTLGGSDFKEQADDQKIWIFSAGLNIPF